MATVIEGKKVKNFKSEATDNKVIQLKELQGKNVVLYFYPKDNTPGCSRESDDFQNNLRKFSARNTIIIGVSRDTIKSHEKFREKFNLKFDLISDPEETLCKQFDVIKEKNMYGKKVLGIERSTFLIDDKGILIKEWRKVKVDGHVDEVLDVLKNHLKPA